MFAEGGGGERVEFLRFSIRELMPDIDLVQTEKSR